MISPDPLPPALLEASAQVARDLGLNENWLNNEPSRNDGGLFQMGLPQGFADRLTKRVFSSRLAIFYIGRLDQISSSSTLRLINAMIHILPISVH